MSNLKDIQAVSGNFIPPGVVIPFAGATAPSGWLLCDGSAISRTTYAPLFAAIASAWGYGDNSTTFNLPDLLGRFLRGKTTDVARDPGYAARTICNTGGNTAGNVGSVQGDVFQAHSHQVDIRGNSNFIQGTVSITGNSAGADVGLGAAAHALGVLGANGSPRASSETRPINANVNYIIKY